MQKFKMSNFIEGLANIAKKKKKEIQNLLDIVHNIQQLVNVWITIGFQTGLSILKIITVEQIIMNLLEQESFYYNLPDNNSLLNQIHECFYNSI
jgi:hypothetical protein